MAITVTPVTLPELTTAQVSGTGVFDTLMRAQKEHLEQEFKAGRIKGSDYATVYLGSMQATLNGAIQFLLEKDKAFGSYFSVFPLGTVIEDFNIRGAKYPLTHHTLVPYDSLCVSNQMEEERVTIDFPEGFVILMETRD